MLKFDSFPFVIIKRSSLVWHLGGSLTCALSYEVKWNHGRKHPPFNCHLSLEINLFCKFCAIYPTLLNPRPNPNRERVRVVFLRDLNEKHSPHKQRRISPLDTDRNTAEDVCTGRHMPHCLFHLDSNEIPSLSRHPSNLLQLFEKFP